MKLEVTADDFNLTPSIETYAEEKIGGLEKYIGRFDEEGGVHAHVILSRTTEHHHKGEVYHAAANFSLPGKTLRAEDTKEDMRAAIDSVKDKLAREIRKYKTQIGAR